MTSRCCHIDHPSSSTSSSSSPCVCVYVNLCVWTSRPRICHALYRAPVYSARTSSLPYPTFIYPSTCLLRRCTPSLPPPTPRRTTRVSARFFLSPPATARSSRLRYLLHAPSLFTPWIHGSTRTGSITMSAPRWKSSTYISSRAFVVFSSVEPIRNLRYVSFDRCCVNTEETANLHITSLINIVITMTMQRLSYFGWTPAFRFTRIRGYYRTHTAVTESSIADRFLWTSAKILL